MVSLAECGMRLRVSSLASGGELPWITRTIRSDRRSNDGAVFLQCGSVDVALGWSLRYSHSPGEVIDTKGSGRLEQDCRDVGRRKSTALSNLNVRHAKAIWGAISIPYFPGFSPNRLNKR